MKPAVLYTRVSTTKQADEGVSLAAQKDQLESYCKALGFLPVAHFTDEGLSGKEMKKRKGLQQALDRVCADKGVLVVYSLSRLARSTKDAISITERLAKCGADLVMLQERIDTTSAGGKMVFTFLAAVAQFQREQTSEQTRDALRHIRKRGGKTGGDVPFGYDMITNPDSGKKMLIPNEKEQEVLMRIRKWRSDRVSMRDIARRLGAQGFKTRRGLAHWSVETVSRILERSK